MTYVGVHTLSKSHLARIIDHFPTSRRYLKRAAVFLALRRCIIRAAKEHMKSGGSLDGIRCSAAIKPVTPLRADARPLPSAPFAKPLLPPHLLMPLCARFPCGGGPVS